ncbi:spermidine N1-acetyltransferase [Chitinasiproducens palmae]|uniref:Spermine/spermidine N-acetyltransferase n=1 Tax=Chitinasiproducens palmae TaxID=1770053 RepID=A0A1H2PNE4_9BURK|nr:spermidine N1-acetyltransferase [Chitinasiproducens palmae]SDV47696.1 spermine/spermidine N-acetyltransferase [Chitinasiproducens palmae]
MPTPHNEIVRLRPLEQTDLHFVHQLDNDAMIMRYWFEEPFETLSELSRLYDEHVHDQRERRFVVEVNENPNGERVGLVELTEIDHIHRRAEFAIVISPASQGKGYASAATRLAIHYAFNVLNLHKLFLVVDVENAAAIHIYEKAGFEKEGCLRDEFFADGRYRTAWRMAIIHPC